MCSFRLSYDESYNQLRQWLDEVNKMLEAPLPLKGTLVEKQEQLDECQVGVVALLSKQNGKFCPCSC